MKRSKGDVLLTHLDYGQKALNEMKYIHQRDFVSNSGMKGSDEEVRKLVERIRADMDTLRLTISNASR